jgi:hypothetical protein
MKFCQPHWDKMRAAVDARGMTPLLADSGEEMATRLERQISDGETTIDNFDPLMDMHWAILNNTDPRVLLMPGDVCPLCHANEMHKQVCEHLIGCMDESHGHHVPWQPPHGPFPDNHEHETYFEWMIDRAADDALARWNEMKL